MIQQHPFRKAWKTTVLLLLLCFGFTLGGCNCLVIIPPVGFKEPIKKPDVPIAPKTPQECDVEVQPKEVKYELTAVGTVKTEKVIVANIGGSSCELKSIRVLGIKPDGHQSFFLSSQARTPYLLMKGGTLELEVSFRPEKQSTKYTGSLLIDSTSPLNPRLTVPLEGESDGPCLKIEPPQLSLGDTQRGCQSRVRAVTVTLEDKPQCPNSVNITDASLSADTSDEFKIDEKLKLPLTVKKGESAEVGVTYKAKDFGLDEGTLQIVVDRYPDPYLIPVEGRGVPDDAQTDSFIQKERSVVDILFVIDSSCSMGDEQQSLADNFNSFIRWAIQLKADYHIGVTTTDTTGRRYAAGCLQGGDDKIITPQTNSPIAAFSRNVRVGTSGSSTERGLQAAWSALQPSALNSCNKDFYRSEAMLSVIFVSDEPEQSRNPVSFYLNFFRNLKGNQSQLLTASAIVGPERTGCATRFGSAGPGKRYRDVANALGGVTASICSGNWASTLNQIGVASFGRRSSFALTRQALPSSIIVKVNDKTVPRDVATGWTFDEKTNTVTFAKTYIPPIGAIIRITYKVACL